MISDSISCSASHVVLQAFQAGWALLPQEQQEAGRFAIALSTGVDSTVLLHAAVSCLGASRCVALHVHHGLNVQADYWQMTAQTMAQRLQVPLATRRVIVNTASGQGIEAAAREARYSALSALCVQESASILLLGHHADDQAETVLLQLLRGAGLPGIAAMPEKPVEREWPYRAETAYTAHAHAIEKEKQEGDALRDPSVRSIIWLRPFLSISREQIHAYALEHRLCWNEDDSNTDTRYTRNALRHDVLPHIAKHFPTYRSAFARVARYAAQAQGLLDELAEIDMQSLSSARKADLEDAHQARALSHTAFKTLLARSSARAVNVLRYWMRIEHIPPASSAWLQEASRQLEKHTAAWQVRHGLFCLSIYKDTMRWERVSSLERSAVSPHPEYETLQWQGESEWPLLAWHARVRFIRVPDHDPAAIPAALLRSQPLTARQRGGGERIRLRPGAPSRTLKKCFQEAGVPAWQRALPLLYLGETLLFVPYIGANLGDIPPITGEPAYSIRLEWHTEPL